MKKPILICIFGFLLFYLPQVNAQKSTLSKLRAKKSAANQDKKFLAKQLWLGPRGGVNLSTSHPGDRYSVYTSTTDPNTKAYNKTYDNFSQLGGQAGIEITYVISGFSISFQPNYRRQSFSYSSSFTWRDDSVPSNLLTLGYKQKYNLDMFEFPLYLKYDILRGDLKPFVQIGGYYNLLVSATRTITTTTLDNASGAIDQYSVTSSDGVTPYFNTSSYGVAFGGGVSYDIGNIRLILDVTYKMGLSNITKGSNRFNISNGVGDALDNMKLNNLVISAGCLFPLRFLRSNEFEAAD